jgi:predicted nucleotidyltransferase
MPIQLELSPEKLAVYRATAKRRHQQEKVEIECRQEKAWQIARQAAQLLREQFKVSRIVVFGSLTRPYSFTHWSDVDIAAWGIAPEDTFRAIGAVMDLGAEIPVNLVDVNTVRPSLLATIERDGIEL